MVFFKKMENWLMRFRRFRVWRVSFVERQVITMLQTFLGRAYRAQIIVRFITVLLSWFSYCSCLFVRYFGFFFGGFRIRYVISWQVIVKRMGRQKQQSKYYYMRVFWQVIISEQRDLGRLVEGFMTQEFIVFVVGVGFCVSCYSRSSGMVSVMEFIQMIVSLVRMDWYRSMGRILGRVLVVTWKRSMFRVQRLKVMIFREDICG